MTCQSSSKPLTVLIVDDVAALRDAYRIFLETQGHSVVTAGDGREAMTMLEQGLRPDLILLDLSMPTMTGWEFRDAQRTDPELDRIPVIVLSAEEVGREEIDKLGCCGILRKPSPAETITAALDRARLCNAARAEGRRLPVSPSPTP